MSSNEERRQAAKQKLEREMTNQAKQAQRRRVLTIVATVVVVVAVVAGGFIYAYSGGPASQAQNSAESSQPDAPPKTTPGQCQYTETDGEAAKPVAMPDDPPQTPSQGVAHITLKTNQGEIPLEIDRAKAPCTAQSFEHLTKAKFFDDTDCHRLTTGEGLAVLQCGDPSGSGSGGPGYEFKDELPTDLQDPPAKYKAQSPKAKVYPRGTLAMANAGPNTNGSQFFIVFQDSYLPPAYSVFGRIDEAGLKVVDKVAAAGVKSQHGGNDGPPNLPVHIDQAVAARG